MPLETSGAVVRKYRPTDDDEHSTAAAPVEASMRNSKKWNRFRKIQTACQRSVQEFDDVDFISPEEEGLKEDNEEEYGQRNEIPNEDGGSVTSPPEILVLGQILDVLVSGPSGGGCSEAYRLACTDDASVASASGDFEYEDDDEDFDEDFWNPQPRRSTNRTSRSSSGYRRKPLPIFKIRSHMTLDPLDPTWQKARHSLLTWDEQSLETIASEADLASVNTADEEEELRKHLQQDVQQDENVVQQDEKDARQEGIEAAVAPATVPACKTDNPPALQSTDRGIISQEDKNAEEVDDIDSIAKDAKSTATSSTSNSTDASNTPTSLAAVASDGSSTPRVDNAEDGIAFVEAVPPPVDDQEIVELFYSQEETEEEEQQQQQQQQEDSQPRPSVDSRTSYAAGRVSAPSTPSRKLVHDYVEPVMKYGPAGSVQFEVRSSPPRRTIPGFLPQTPPKVVYTQQVINMWTVTEVEKHNGNDVELDINGQLLIPEVNEDGFEIEQRLIDRLIV